MIERRRCSPNRITLRGPNTGSTRQFILLDLVKEGFFALCQEFLDRQFMFGVVRVQHLQFLYEILCDTTIRIGELE
jgi:hypothetical protein